MLIVLPGCASVSLRRFPQEAPDAQNFSAWESNRLVMR